jgi:hypothetical protein
MLRRLGWLAVLFLVAACAFDQVWVRQDGKNIRNDEKLTRVFLRDNGTCDAQAARGLHRSGETIVLGGDTEYGTYGGVTREDEEEAEREREMQRANRFRACMKEKGYEQISAEEADARFGKRPEGFEAPF